MINCLYTRTLEYQVYYGDQEEYHIHAEYDSQTVSGKRLEWTKVRTGENNYAAMNFNEIKNQCEHPFGGSDQQNNHRGSLTKTYQQH